MSDVTTKGKTLTKAECDRIQERGIDMMRDAFKERPDAWEVGALCDLAEAGLALASAADISIPAMRELVRDNGKRLVKVVGAVLSGESGLKAARAEAEAVALMGEVGCHERS